MHTRMLSLGQRGLPCRSRYVVVLAAILLTALFLLKANNNLHYLRQLVRGSAHSVPTMIQESRTFDQCPVQKRRHERLRNVCQLKSKQSKLSSYTSQLWPSKNGIIMKDLSFMVCQCAKAGSTFWRDYLAPLHEWTFMENAPSPLLREAESNYLTAIFVRHPLYRLYSSYNDKVVGMAGTPGMIVDTGKSIYRRYRRNTGINDKPCYDDITFEEFVRLAISEVKFYKNARNAEIHRRPFFASCLPCQYRYDIIGKLETFTDDVSVLITSLNARGANFSLDRNDMMDVYIDDKCRHLQENRTFPLGRSREDCSALNVVLPTKLKSLWNKGFTANDGFSMAAFENLPRSEWELKCKDMVRKVLDKPGGKTSTHDIALTAAKTALQNLPRELYYKLVQAYSLDLEMFGYDPEEPLAPK